MRLRTRVRQESESEGLTTLMFELGGVGVGLWSKFTIKSQFKTMTTLLDSNIVNVGIM